MSFLEHVIQPKSFFGLTDLRTGALIIAAVEFIFAVLDVLGINNTYSTTLALVIALVCTGLGVWGILKSKTSYVKIFYYYLIVHCVFSLIIFVLSFITFSLTFILISLLSLAMSLYSVCVVKSYLKQEGSSSAAFNAGKV